MDAGLDHIHHEVLEGSVGQFLDVAPEDGSGNSLAAFLKDLLG